MWEVGGARESAPDFHVFNQFLSKLADLWVFVYTALRRFHPGKIFSAPRINLS